MFESTKELFRQEKGMRTFLLACLLFASSSIIPFLGQLVVVGWAATVLQDRFGIESQSAHPRSEHNFPLIRFQRHELWAYVRHGLPGYLCRVLWLIPGLALPMFVLLIILPLIAVLFAPIDFESPVAIIVIVFVIVLLGIFTFIFNVISLVAETLGHLDESVESGVSISRLKDVFSADPWGLFWLSTKFISIGIVLNFIGLLFCGIGTFAAAVILQLVAVDLFVGYFEKNPDLLPD